MTDLENLITAQSAIARALAALEQVDSSEARQYARALRTILFQDNGASGLATTIDILLRAEGDALITMREAASIAGRSLSQISNMARRGDLVSIEDKTEPNPTRRTRLLRSQVERIKPKR